MKKNIKIIVLQLFILIILIFAFMGCRLLTEVTPQTTEIEQTSASETTTEPVAESTSIDTEEQTTQTTGADRSIEVENEFNALDKSKANIKEVFDFIDANIKDVLPGLSSEMIYSVMKLCEEYKFDFTDKFANPGIQEAIFSTLPSPENIDLNLLVQSNNQEVKDIAQEAIDKKYKLISVEGFIMPLVDYKAYDGYRPYLTEEMNDYMNIKLDESERPSVMDAGIVIPVDDFVQRIIKSMDYVKKYPDSPRAEEVQQFNKGRIYVYFSGIDNNPVFDSNLMIIPDKLTEFEDIFTIYGDTDFGNLLGSYLDLLVLENYTRTQNVEDFLNNIY